MKERPVVEWRMSSSIFWLGLIVGIAVITGAIALSQGDLMSVLYVVIVAGVVAMASLIHLVIRSKRTQQIAALKQASAIINAKITGVRETRRFDIDLSPLSLLDGSSGIGFPKVVSFEVRDGEDRLIVSQPTNVPSELAERYIGLPVSVYISPVSGERYVDIEALPPFNPMDAITSVIRKK